MQKETLSLFWRFTKPYRVRQSVALVGVCLSVLIESFIAPLVLAQFLNQLQSGTVSLTTSWPLVVMYGLILVASTIVLWRITLWATWSFEVAAQRDLGAKILDHLTSMSARFHANHFGGSLISQTGKLVSSLERFWDTIIWETLPVVTSIIAAVVILWFVNPAYSIFIGILSIIFAIAVFFGSRFMLARNLADVQAWSKTTGYISDIITNVMTVKAFGREKYERDNTYKHYDEWQEKSIRTRNGFLAASSAYATLSTAITVGALVFAIIASEQHAIAIGSVYLMLTYTMVVTRQLWNINNVMRSYNRIMGDAHDMVEILQESPEIKDTSTKKLTARGGTINFESVDFTHDKGDGVRVFDNFSLTIPQGQRIGLIGRSGSGKTTLTRLLLRFSDIDSGKISIDDQSINTVSQRSLHEAISYVSQEPMMFHRSLRDNIAYGKPNATDKEIEDAAKQAHAHEFITRLPEGYDTLVGERGVKLSGGQRQRIAIARAILKDAPILVLDEATSALDSESEKLIQASFEILMKNRTSIVIAHRLSTISKLDRIIVLDNGKITEDGTHEELLKYKGIYAKLWSHQSGGFIEE